LNDDKFVDFIAAIPDLTSHRFMDTDGYFSVKIHEPREVAERVVAALRAERIDFDDPVFEGTFAPRGECIVISCADL
jgi:hypothetical protein